MTNAVTTSNAQAEKEISTVSTTAKAFADYAKSLVITSNEECEAALLRNSEIKKAIKVAETWKETFWRPLKTAADHMAGLVNPTLKVLEDAEQSIRNKVAQYQFVIMQEQKKKAEEERKAAEDKALAEAAEREKEAKEEAERVKAASLKREEELRAAGKDSIADAVAEQREQSLQDIASDVEVDTNKSFAVAGKLKKIDKTFKTSSGVSISVHGVWKGEVTDESLVPREYLMVDQVKINQAVKSGVREIAGVKIHEVAQGASR